MDYSAITQSSSEVARLARVAPNTLQAWVKRGVIAGYRDNPDKIGGGGRKGKHLKWSFWCIMEVAVAQALVSTGVSELGVAFRAAYEFAHLGDELRLPGLPFDRKRGQTILVLSRSQTKVLQWEPGTDPIALFWSEMRKPESWITVNVAAVFRRVVTELGLDPAAVMQEAYGKSLGEG